MKIVQKNYRHFFVCVALLIFLGVLQLQEKTVKCPQEQFIIKNYCEGCPTTTKRPKTVKCPHERFVKKHYCEGCTAEGQALYLSNGRNVNLRTGGYAISKNHVFSGRSRFVKMAGNLKNPS